jgi:hypothetical protein
MAQVSQFPGGEYPLGDAAVYEGGEGWPPVRGEGPQDWPYTIGAARSRRFHGFGDSVVYEGAETGWPPESALPQDWLYTIGAWRKSKRRGLRGLGDDTPDAIRIYVPRLAAGLYAIDVYETGLTPDSMPPVEPIATARWNNRLATKFAQEAKRLIGFIPVVHEPEGSDVIYAHMAGATGHTEAERIWAPMQRALNQARNATGVGAPADPYASQPRAWETSPPLPASVPIAPVAAHKGAMDLVLGIAMVVGGIVLL